MTEYNPQAVEQKWQQRWRDSRAFEVTEDPSKPKFYCLEMFAYPSGHAHVGHVRNYMIGDVMARTKRMRGFNVLHPFGWDAFGLPAENAAIKNGIHPRTSTLANIAHMKGQLQRLGISYAWERELATCLPDYYKWNQWLFLRMFERDLAYRRRSTVNWCSSCQTVLANEQVVDGGCWRCHTLVTHRDLEQWFLRITHYADELLSAIDGLEDWPEKVLTMQRNWIGRSEGARVRFPLVDPTGLGTGADIEVFTTRIDTIFGATFVLLAPEHELLERLAAESGDPGAMRAAAARFRRQDRSARLTGEVEKEGFSTGRFAINPFTGQQVPIWVANFVLGEYGTGAVMAVPAHDQRDFEFARKYGLPVRVVIQPEGDGAATLDAPTMTEAYSEPGRIVDSGEYTGLWSTDALRIMAEKAERRGHRPAHGPVPPEGLGHLAAAVLGHADPDHPLPGLRPGARARRPAAGRTARRSPSSRAAAIRRWRAWPSSSTCPARRAAAPRGARPTRWTPSSTRRGTSTGSATRRTTRSPSIRRRWPTGRRSTSTAAASSTPSCT